MLIMHAVIVYCLVQLVYFSKGLLMLTAADPDPLDTALYFEHVVLLKLDPWILVA